MARHTEERLLLDYAEWLSTTGWEGAGEAEAQAAFALYQSTGELVNWEAGPEPRPTVDEQDGTRSPGGEWIYLENEGGWVPYTGQDISEPPEQLLTFNEWMAQTHPNVVIGELAERVLANYQRQYNDYVDNFGQPPDPPTGEPRPTGDEQDGTRSPGGEWIYLENEGGWVPYTGQDVSEPPTDGQNLPYFDEDTGRWFDPLTGTYHATEDDAYASYNAALQAQGFEQDLAQQVEDYLASIQDIGERQTAEAQRLGARNTGLLARNVRNALLAQGRSAGEIEQLSAGGIEGAQRSLSDLVRQINLQTQGQRAGAQQFGIGTTLDAAGLRQQGRSLAFAQSQFGQGLRQRNVQFGQNLAEQARQFGLDLGLRGQALSQQGSQFNAQMLQQRYQFGQNLDFRQQQLLQQGNQFTQNLGQQANQFNQSQPGFWDYASQFAAPLGSIAAAKIFVGCFDSAVSVTTPNGNLPISMLNPGDMVKTQDGFKSVVAIHEYEQPPTIAVNGIKGRPHPFVMADGSLQMSHKLKPGDMLWNDIRVDDVTSIEGRGKVYNLDIPGNTYYLAGGILVHTGRDRS